MATEEAALIIPLTGPWIPTSREYWLAEMKPPVLRLRQEEVDDRTRVESDGSFRYG